MAYSGIFRTVDIFSQFQTLLKSNSHATHTSTPPRHPHKRATHASTPTTQARHSRVTYGWHTSTYERHTDDI